MEKDLDLSPSSSPPSYTKEPARPTTIILTESVYFGTLKSIEDLQLPGKDSDGKLWLILVSQLSAQLQLPVLHLSSPQQAAVHMFLEQLTEPWKRKTQAVSSTPRPNLIPPPQLRVLPPGHPLRGRAALRRGISRPAGPVSSWLRRVSPCVFGGKVWHTHRCRRPPLGFSLAWTLLSLQPRAPQFPFSDSGTTAPRLLSAHPPAAPIPVRPHLRRQRQGDVPVRALPPFTRSRAASPSSARSRQRAHPRRLLRQPTAPSPRRRPHCAEVLSASLPGLLGGAVPGAASQAAVRGPRGGPVVSTRGRALRATGSTIPRGSPSGYFWGLFPSALERP
ncbi:uncharacterized protein LOC116545398 [Sapajus apella]|uniref:Uncharacterized protein LOC116545398 n=1 Tax=Sapajus apella TaxID=9515 RepID=A0A6J3HD56_SAPAP|nr:uncharacterized protein LOC116545398 [Sapajus apella]